MLKIFLPKNEGIYQIAADEVRKYWRLVTGVELESTQEDDGSDLIVVGSDAVNAFTHAKIIEKVIPQFRMATGSDAYYIHSACEPNGRRLLFLAGARPRSILYAVYRFFELRANCRYFWDGDIVPHADGIDITGLDVTESPRFSYRGLRYFAHRSLTRFQAEHWDLDEWKREIDWILKKRLNLFMLRTGLDDLFQKTFPEIVHYPKDYVVPEAKPRSYDDRTLFWSLEYRGELRKALLAYARERDLLHPEDLGTMTHWYSRTPNEYLDAVKPDFIPQVTGGYSERTGLVWDIRQDANLDAYFKLTEAHIREYGAPDIFHTIGLAERRCYDDREANHQMKLYTYRRIQSKLREKYPNAPLLIGSWDFSMYWQPEEVRELLNELDPANTLIFDYISDTEDEKRNFQNWDVMGRFPWIYGIFHAYESNTEQRGNYEAIARRLPLAVRDPMCKGLVFWPENSHADTLMLEFMAANAWEPSKENYTITIFLEKFLGQRYLPAEFSAMQAIWRKVLPFIEAMHWNAYSQYQLQEGIAFRNMHYEFFARPDSAFLWLEAVHIQRANYYRRLLQPVVANAPALLREIAAIEFARAGEFVFRDALDIVRTIASRCMLAHFCDIILGLREWCDGRGDIGALEALFDRQRTCETLLRDILAASDDYSLYVSLMDLQRKHETNPDFEYTLKGNAENSYCRSYITELFDGVYLPEYDVCVNYWRDNFKNGVRAIDRTAVDKAIQQCRDAFYAKPLRELAIASDGAKEALADNLRKLAEAVL